MIGKCSNALCRARGDVKGPLRECAACYSYRYRTGKARDPAKMKPGMPPQPALPKSELYGVRAQVDRQARWQFVVAMVWLTNEELERMP